MLSRLIIATACLLAPSLVWAAPTCERVLVRSSQMRVVEAMPRFSATRIIDVSFHILFPEELASEHTLHLEVHTPKGHLFQRLDVPIAENTSGKETRVVKGYRRPLPVTPLQPFELDGNHKKVARVRFPVAGTSIIESSLYGRWRVTITMDDQKNACGAASFILTE